MKRLSLQPGKLCGRLLSIVALMSVTVSCQRVDPMAVQIYDSTTVKIYARPSAKHYSPPAARTTPMYLSTNGVKREIYTSGGPTTFMVTQSPTLAGYPPKVVQRSSILVKRAPGVRARPVATAKPVRMALQRRYIPPLGLPPEPILASHRKVAHLPLIAKAAPVRRSPYVRAVRKPRINTAQMIPPKVRPSRSQIRHIPAPKTNAVWKQEDEVFRFLIEEQDLFLKELFPLLIEEQDLS